MLSKCVSALLVAARQPCRPAATMSSAGPEQVLRFWFGNEWYDGPPGGFNTSEYTGERVKLWFMGGADVDQRCREFIPRIRAAGRGELRGPAWSSRDGLIAQLVLLDQLSRNAFRGQPEAFAYDARAVELVSRLIEQAGAAPASVPSPATLFIATCLMHSEELARHEQVHAFCEAHVVVSRAPLLERQLRKDLSEHTAVLRRFGRYPHRNTLYGRDTTAAEAAWLASADAPGWSRSQQSK